MKRSLPQLATKLRELECSYADYLRGNHWQAFRAAWVPRRTRNGRAVCEFCLAGHLRLDLHHRTYKRLGRERLNDVVLICSDCHGRVHRWYAEGRKSLWTITKAVQGTARKRVA